MASSLEEVSGAHGDYSGGSRSHDAPPDHFAVFKDFDFLEYESESIEVCIMIVYVYKKIHGLCNVLNLFSGRKQ